jgi:hypothetical protein
VAQAYLYVSLQVPEEGVVKVEMFARWTKSPSSEVPQPVARFYAQMGTGAFLLLATLIKIPAKLAAHGAARRVNNQSQKKRS